MLEELKNLETPGNKEGLIFFIEQIIGNKILTYQDIRVLCSHIPSTCQIVFPDIIKYCLILGWIEKDRNFIKINPDFLYDDLDSEKLNVKLIVRTLEFLFQNEIFQNHMYEYDLVLLRIVFHNEMLPLNYSVIRNTLIKMGFFKVKHFEHETIFYVAPNYEKYLADICKEERKKITLAQLHQKLDHDEEIGALAEEFVLSYEQRRLGAILSPQIKIISDIDVTAGYDIISYETENSCTYDRYIEVKAISHTISFYWSKNEYEVAQFKGNHYYLYLVEINRLKEEGYIPIIIQDPAKQISPSSDWLMEPQSYYVYKLKY